MNKFLDLSLGGQWDFDLGWFKPSHGHMGVFQPPPRAKATPRLNWGGRPSQLFPSLILLINILVFNFEWDT
jgi:hypothetical protein